MDAFERKRQELHDERKRKRQELRDEREKHWNKLMSRYENSDNKKEFPLEHIEQIVSVKHGLHKPNTDRHSNDRFRNKYKRNHQKYQSETDSVDSVSYVLKCKEQIRNSSKFKINNLIESTFHDQNNCNGISDFKNDNNILTVPELQNKSSSDSSDQIFFKTKDYTKNAPEKVSITQIRNDTVNKYIKPNEVVKDKYNEPNVRSTIENNRVDINTNSENQQITKCNKYQKLKTNDCATPVVITEDVNHKNEYRKRLQPVASKNINNRKTEKIVETISQTVDKRELRLKAIDAENIKTESLNNLIVSKKMVYNDRFEIKNTETEGIFPCVFKSDRQTKLVNQTVCKKRKRKSPTRTNEITKKITLSNDNAKHISSCMKRITFDYFLSDASWKAKTLTDT